MSEEGYKVLSQTEEKNYGAMMADKEEGLESQNQDTGGNGQVIFALLLLKWLHYRLVILARLEGAWSQLCHPSYLLLVLTSVIGLNSNSAVDKPFCLVAKQFEIYDGNPFGRTP